jgi:hypothetical protein
VKKLLFTLLGLSLLSANAKIPEKESKTEKTKQEIETQIRKDYGLDSLKINFEILPENYPYHFLGLYNPEHDSLKLNYYNILKTAETIDENLDTLIARTMRHELAHYKVDKIREKFGIKAPIEDKYFKDLLEVYFAMLRLNEQEPGHYTSMINKFIKIKESDLKKALIDNLINEGVGTYYERFGQELVIKNIWLSSLGEIINISQYEITMSNTSKNLMYPIISKYGEKGIEYVVKNVPSEKDFSNLQEYQKKVLKKLEKKTKTSIYKQIVSSKN